MNLNAEKPGDSKILMLRSWVQHSTRVLGHLHVAAMKIFLLAALGGGVDPVRAPLRAVEVLADALDVDVVCPRLSWLGVLAELAVFGVAGRSLGLGSSSYSGSRGWRRGLDLHHGSSGLLK